MTIEDPLSRIKDRQLIAHLATATDGNPHVAPVWYACRDGDIVILTDGRKLNNANVNPRVALSIHTDSEDEEGWFVSIQGTATVIDDTTAINEAARLIYPQYLSPDSDTWDPMFRKELSDSPRKQLLVIEIGSIASAET